ncbi:MAG: homoserine O-succinyltransferase [Eubacteriales bacterium]|nr:homoserine O-succinyltransferase [Eubacteriales bacterium]MDD3199932.1 homoserine O-succinyltransferase [Eubacteriales bacterium]MDD4630566.1 homoserine O-succinyltransferase [Eubacteriales bacterium]
MPIIVPKELPAYKTLREENVFVMPEKRAQKQDIRPLRIAIVNLMPTKEVTETQLIRMLANTPLQVELELLTMYSHESKNTDQHHLDNFYKTYEEIKHQRYDGMIITGAPVEYLPFSEVDYWKELTEIFEYTKSNVFSTLHICWGAQAALYYHYGIDKYVMPEKLFGVFKHTLKDKKSELTRGFDEEFYAPHSRHTQVRKEDIQNIPELKILAESEATGPHIIATRDKRMIFVQGHMEYERDTLKLEYERDIKKGLKIDVPMDYFKDNNPTKRVIVKWSGHGNLFFANWLNYIYQETPYDLNKLDELNKK